MLRKMAVLAVVLLTGCGRPYAPAAAVAPGAMAPQSARFVEVLRSETHLRNAFQTAATLALTGGKPLQVPTGEHGELEIATGISLDWIAVRGNEAIGEATIGGQPTQTFLPHQVKRAVRVTLDGKLDPDFKGLAAAPIDRVKLEAIDEAAAAKAQADLKAFLLQPAQAELRKGRLWGAIAGTETHTTAKLRAFKATRVDHGKFGRVFGFEVELRFNGAPVIDGMDAGFVTDKAGRLIAVN